MEGLYQEPQTIDKTIGPDWFENMKLLQPKVGGTITNLDVTIKHAEQQLIYTTSGKTTTILRTIATIGKTDPYVQGEFQHNGKQQTHGS